MSRFYRVIKATPAWEVGAILEDSEDGGYAPISDLWNTPAREAASSSRRNYYELDYIVENSPKWFERVFGQVFSSAQNTGLIDALKQLTPSCTRTPRMSRPCCPESHPGVEMQPTDNPRIWICVISDCRFEVEVDIDAKSKKKDKFGKLITSYKITQLDGGGDA